MSARGRVIASSVGIVVVLAMFVTFNSLRGPRPPAGASATIQVVPTDLDNCPRPAECDEDCARGKGEACTRLGNSYARGKAVAKDEARAAVYFERACAAGHGPGCSSAARVYEFGHGVAVDERRAFAFNDRACGLGYAVGCYNAALMLERGIGTAPDTSRARALFDKACDGGARSACEAARRLGERSDPSSSAGSPGGAPR